MGLALTPSERKVGESTLDGWDLEPEAVDD